MNTKRIDDVRIKSITKVFTPKEIIGKYPITDYIANLVYNVRDEIKNILFGKDNRLLVVVGPCSVHNPKAALEYANKLLEVAKVYNQELLIVMRVYFEKPRTTIGWKGLINDPGLNETFQINEGLEISRQLLVQINALGMPAGTEFLDLMSPQYYADLISWGAIGARTTESQGHRELASGLSCPVGFKNGTDGSINIAIDAIRAANNEHIFMSHTKGGHSAIFSTTGNRNCHVILRGGNKGPNYTKDHIQKTVKALENKEVCSNIMVDCSHANSRKIAKNQINIVEDLSDQLESGNKNIVGIMIESNLVAGYQSLTNKNYNKLTYGQSITDECVGWADTVKMLKRLAGAVRIRNAK